jgi:hypothetical protein
VPPTAWSNQKSSVRRRSSSARFSDAKYGASLRRHSTSLLMVIASASAHESMTTTGSLR